MVEALPDATAVWDERGKRRRVNERLSVLTGSRREELIDQYVRMLVPRRHGHDESPARGQYTGDAKTRLIWSDHDLAVLCREVSEQPVDFALTPFTLNAEPWSIALIHLNNAQKAAEVDRREIEERFFLAFEENRARTVITNFEDLVIAANDAFCDVVGFSKDGLFGRDSKPLAYPNDIGVSEGAHSRETLGEADQVRCVKRCLHKDVRDPVAEVTMSTTLRPVLRYFRARHHR